MLSFSIVHSIFLFHHTWNIFITHSPGTLYLHIVIFIQIFSILFLAHLAPFVFLMKFCFYIYLFIYLFILFICLRAVVYVLQEQKDNLNKLTLLPTLWVLGIKLRSWILAAEPSCLTCQVFFSTFKFFCDMCM